MYAQIGLRATGRRATMSTEVRGPCQWALPEDLGLGLLWWGNYCALLACLQDQTFPFSAAPSQGQRSPPLRDCFGSGTAAAEQCRRPGALGPDRDLPTNGALTVEQVGSGVAIEKPQ